jgi:hypothetical protein
MIIWIRHADHVAKVGTNLANKRWSLGIVRLQTQDTGFNLGFFLVFKY